MLENLFGSQSRVRLLKLFMTHPENKYYIRQLARDLELQLNSVRRELENLEKFGLLRSHTNTLKKKEIQEEGVETAIKRLGTEKKYYQVNKDFILYEEIKNLIVKSQILHEMDFVEKIRSLDGVRLLVLTGFFVGLSDSPVDILAVGHVDKDQLMKVIKELEHNLGREINYSLFDMKEFNYRMEMTDVFLYGVLERKKLMPINELDIS